MRQRVVVAAALANDPPLLIADEPSTALDVTIQAQILELLLAMRERHDTAILLITHDLGVVAQVCDRVAVMYAGQLVELAPTVELFRAPRHPYTQALLAAQPTSGLERGRLRVIQGEVADLSDPPPGCRFTPRCPLAFEACVGTPSMSATGPGHTVACWAAERSAPEGSTEAELAPAGPRRSRPTARWGYRHDRPARSAADREAFPDRPPAVREARCGPCARRGGPDDGQGELVALVGESGSGKTTLARCVLGLTRPSDGTILLDDSEVEWSDKDALRAFRRRVQPVFQDVRLARSALVDRPDDQGAARCVRHRVARGTRRSRLRAARPGRSARAVHVTPSARAFRRPAPARRDRCGTRARPRISSWPTNRSRPWMCRSRRKSLNLLSELNESLGVAILLITHDLAIVEHICDRAVVLYLGRVAEGSRGPALRGPGASLHPRADGSDSSTPTLAVGSRWPWSQAESSPIHPPPGCRFHTRCMVAIERCRVDEPALEPYGPGHRAACHVSLLQRDGVSTTAAHSSSSGVASAEAAAARRSTSKLQ